MTIETGTKLGRYEIRSQIGNDGMGEVFGSQDTTLGSQSRIEDFAIRTHLNRDRRECFIREAKLELLH
jgi:hypothetical protein